ncbi:MAG: hypothetical protein ABI663_21940 [Chryseolinea sp.]
MKPLAFITFLFLSQTAFAQFDSLKVSMPSLSIDTLTTLTGKIDSIEASTRGRIDSVTQYYTKATAKVNGLKSHYQQKIDSLSHLNLPTEKYAKKVDSLQNELTAVKQKVEDRIQSIKQKTTEKLNSIPLPPELQAKASQLTGSLDKLNLSSLSSEINSPIDLKSLDTSLDKLIPSNGLNGISELPSTGGLPDVSKNLGGVSDLTKGVTEQTGTLQQSASEITKGVGDVNQLDKLAESQVTKLDAVKDLKDATGNLPVTSMPSEDQAKQQVLQQVQSAAVDHFAGKQEQLQAAMDKLSKYKAKYESLPSVGDLPKRLFCDLKGKPLVERIVPGIQFQILSKQGNFMVDFNAYAGYRLTSKLTSGIGWNQRFAYNRDQHEFNAQARIFGPRAFAEYKLGRGFLPRVEIETMNTSVPPFTSSKPADVRSREWVVNAFVGMKKEYRFFKNVKGTTSIMLNVYHPHHNNLYADVVNARFGFEFPMRKKAKKVNG